MARSPISPILAALLVDACLLLAPGLGLAQDADGDLMPDSYETAFGCLMPNTVDADVDYDADAMTSLEEYTYSPLLNPCNPDTDKDGLPDGWEYQYLGCGFDPLSYGSEIAGFEKGGADLRVTSADHDSWNPSLTWTGSEYGVCWYDERDGNYEIYFARVSAAGVKIGADLRVAPNGYGSLAPSLSWTGSEFGVSWQDFRNLSYEIYFARVSVAGVKIGADLRVTNNDGSGSTYPSLFWAGSEYGVSWDDFSNGNDEIYFARVSADGVKIGSDLRLTSSGGISSSSLTHK